MSSAICLLREQIEQAPQHLRSVVESAQAERDAVVQQHATVLAALRAAEQAKRKLVHKDIEHSSGVVRLKVALSAAAADTERLQQEYSVLRARINELQQANDDLQQCSSTVKAERDALRADVQQLSAQASEHVQCEQELLATVARQDTLLKVAKADTEKWLQDSVRRTREAQHQREPAAAAQKELAVAMQQKQHAQVKIDVMHATQRRLYDSLALRAARRRRGFRSTREDTVSDVCDRAAFAVLSTMLVFDSSDAIQAIAAAKEQSKQEATTAKAAQETQDAAVAAALVVAQAEPYTAQTKAVAAAVEAAQHTAAMNQAAVLAAAAQQAAVEQEQAVAAVKKSTAAFNDDDDEAGLCRVCLNERSDVV
jgi:DNA repair exonuclease SbcCD ATPase subunit